jgi:hypothetical protein
MNGVTFDAEGLCLAWARSIPGLIGKGCPILGLHLNDDLRSPQTGVLGSLRVGASEVDMEGLGHTAPMQFEFKAVGGDAGARRQCERAARAFLTEVRKLTGVPVLVTAGGVTAKLTHAWNVRGPVWLGSPGGEATYRGDANFVWQSA